ncbi:hypothetical protein HDU76_012604 [Blyttiomyces sp. JEL0837]|nr:hypothetical protein HDU76_012604 [Blyttiomyces sp. JEL0837]
MQTSMIFKALTAVLILAMVMETMAAPNKPFHLDGVGYTTKKTTTAKKTTAKKTTTALRHPPQKTTAKINYTPPCANPYRVVNGDSCNKITALFEIPYQTLAKLNPDLVCNKIKVGQIICLPKGARPHYKKTTTANYVPPYVQPTSQYVPPPYVPPTSQYIPPAQTGCVGAASIYGPFGDGQGAPCDTEGQVNNLHCVGPYIAQCARSKWVYLSCPNNLVCTGPNGQPACDFAWNVPVYVPPPNQCNYEVTTTAYYIPPTNPPYLPPTTTGYVAPPNPTYGTGNPTYGPNGDAEGASCSTEQQLNNVHCAGTKIAQCAKDKWVYLPCPGSLVCNGPVGNPFCDFAQNVPAYVPPTTGYVPPPPTTGYVPPPPTTQGYVPPPPTTQGYVPPVPTTPMYTPPVPTTPMYTPPVQTTTIPAYIPKPTTTVVYTPPAPTTPIYNPPKTTVAQVPTTPMYTPPAPTTTTVPAYVPKPTTTVYYTPPAPTTTTVPAYVPKVTTTTPVYNPPVTTVNAYVPPAPPTTTTTTAAYAVGGSTYFGPQGDALNAPCDTDAMANYTHCVGNAIAQCGGGRWLYQNCASGLVCIGPVGNPACARPSK